MADTQSNAGAIWALGITQIIGYGTLYYSFSILAPNVAGDLQVPVEWIYGCISLALLAGGLVSPWAGGLADRVGAGKVMSIGSIGAAAALATCGLAGSAMAFLAGVILVELASAFVLYSTAFAFLAQTTGSRAQRSITYLTLIAGFASTIFWPLTTWLLQATDWHQVYFLFAGLMVAISSMTTPAVMPTSARLKVGKCQPPACRSMKSVTAPSGMRSTRLPSAPPRMAA